MQIVVKDVKCPTCGVGPSMVAIRGFKVFMQGKWWSQCLVCAGYYDKDFNLTPQAFEKDRGWFA